jgi:hypothetical protein
MKILTLLFALLLGSEALAATTRDCATLYSASGVLTSTNGSIFRIGDGWKHLKFISTAAPVSGTTPTLDIKIQHCRMKGDGTCSTTCSDTAAVFTQCTTSTCYGGDNIEHIDANTDTVNFLPCVRAVTTMSGTNPNYTVAVEVCGAK